MEQLSLKQFEIVIKLTPNDVDEEAFEDALEIKDDDQMRFKVLRSKDSTRFFSKHKSALKLEDLCIFYSECS